jgi:SsrA-binding protein
MVLLGTEIKSMRTGKVSFNDSYCLIDDGEVWLKSLNIAQYSHGNMNNHDPVRDRKLLLHKKEITKIVAKLKEKGYTLVPLRIFMNSKNLAKIEIGLAKGKKLHDKRESIKQKDVEREMKRYLK